MSAEYLVAPQGSYPFAGWSCIRCPAASGLEVQARDKAREEATAHVRQTGHQVTVESGTRELLCGMATGAQS